MKSSHNDGRPLRVLLIAEAANPEFTSVPLVGWSHVRAIMEITDSHLITQVRNRDAIVRAGLVEGQDFTAIDSEAVAAPMYSFAKKIVGNTGKGWTVITAFMGLAYYYFEYKVWQEFGARIEAGEFDIVHRITPLSPTTPSILAKRCKAAGVPFLLGPLNGGVPWPKGFDSERRKEREWLSYVRSAYKLLPYYRSTLRDSTAVLVASGDTLGQTPEEYRDKCYYLPENAIDPERFPKSPVQPAGLPLKAAFIGRLVPYKGADMLLEAAAPLLRAGDMTLKIIGDGPMGGELKALAEKLELGDSVEFTGWVNHTELRSYLNDVDLLTFPSIREFGGGVVLEAMAAGIVPVIVNYGGPGELVTDNTGFRVPIGTRAQITEGFRSVLLELKEDPSRLDEMKARCLRRAHEQFTWAAKAAAVHKLYEATCRTGDNPRKHFPFPIPDLD